MTIPLETRFTVLKRDNFTCQFCGRVAPETELEVDHLRARTNGGSDDLANLVTSCRDCNRGKGRQDVDLPDSGWRSLVGKWFHSYGNNGAVKRQGRIIEGLGQGYFVVECYEFMTGAPAFGGQHIVSISRIEREGWSLYADDAEMREAWEHGGLQVKTERLAAASR